MKILLFDLETAPHLSLTWGKYEQNVISFVEYYYLLTFSWKWADEKQVHALTLADFKGFKKNPHDDASLVSELWKLFDKADIIVAHNAMGFDYKMARSFFLRHGLKPHSPVKVVDTKAAAKSVGRFPSNKLDDLGDYFHVGRKIHTDKTLWERCMAGDKKAFSEMARYNKQDVILLEKVYLLLRPWMSNHPNMNVLGGIQHACPKCGSEHIQSRGSGCNNTRVYTRYQCQSCKGWFQSLATEKSGITTK